MKTPKLQDVAARNTVRSGGKSADAKDALAHAEEVEEITRQIDLSRCVPAVLTAAANRLSHGASAAYRKEAGIGFVDWRILCFLASEGWSSGAELASGLGSDKAAISRSLSALVKLGILETRASRGRRSESNLTPKGIALRSKVLRVALAREAAILRGLSASDKEHLLSMLNLISRNLVEMDGAN